MTRLSTRVMTSAAALLAVAVLATTAGLAQEPRTPRRISVTMIQLKPDMAATWDRIMRDEDIPARKKAGFPWQHVWQNGVFAQNFTRVVVRPVDTYAQYDQPTAVAKLLGPQAFADMNSRMNATMVGSKAISFSLQRDLTLDSGAATLPALLHVSFRQTHPGRAAEFAKVLKEDFMPNFRKTGIKDYWTYQSSLGAPAGLFLIIRPIANYAELETPSMMSRTLGADSAPAYGRINPTLSSVEFDVYRVMQDLSYGSWNAPPSTN